MLQVSARTTSHEGKGDCELRLAIPADVPENRPQTHLMHVETRTRAAIAFVLACTSIVAAQEPAAFRTSTDVVLVPISVTDRDGRFVRGLTADHFQISDGGTRRAVKQFSAERVPDEPRPSARH